MAFHHLWEIALQHHLAFQLSISCRLGEVCSLTGHIDCSASKAAAAVTTCMQQECTEVRHLQLWTVQLLRRAFVADSAGLAMCVAGCEARTVEGLQLDGPAYMCVTSTAFVSMGKGAFSTSEQDTPILLLRIPMCVFLTSYWEYRGRIA